MWDEPSKCPNACGYCCESAGQFKWAEAAGDGLLEGHPDLKALAEITLRDAAEEYCQCDMLRTDMQCALQSAFGYRVKPENCKHYLCQYAIEECGAAVAGLTGGKVE